MNRVCLETTTCKMGTGKKSVLTKNILRNLSFNATTRFPSVNTHTFIPQAMKQHNFLVQTLIYLSRNQCNSTISFCEYSYSPATYALTCFPAVNTHILVFISQPMQQHDFVVQIFIYSCFRKGCPKKAKSVRDNPER